MNVDPEFESGELTRLRERVAILEREIVAVRSQPLSESLDKSPIPIWIVCEEKIVIANKASAKLVGAQSSSELIGRSVFEFLEPEFHQMVQARAREELEFQRETPVVEERIVTFHGRPIDVQVSTFPFIYEGRPARHVSLIDITARKESERRSLEISERFHELAENFREVFTIVDAKKKTLLYVSPGYEVVWQRSRQSLYDRPASWMDSIHPDDEARLRAAVEFPESFKEEYRILTPSGETRWIRARTFPVTGPEGELLRIVGFSEDISEWKRLEQQLVQSQKMDAVGRLAGGIAHDFNNLLTVINGYATMLALNPAMPAEAVRDLESIRRAGERATSLTAQLLAFSRKQILQPKNIDLNVSVREVEPILRRLIREDVELRTVTMSGRVCVKADPSQIEQVLLNLVINARDAIEGMGHITIETGKVDFDAESVRLHPGCLPGRYAMIAVSDSGRGMNAHTQERIFEPFFTTKAVGHGTGLGLATVYGIVKQSGGAIWVYSEENVGSTFKVYLPLAAHPSCPEPSPELPETARGTATILLVEDDEQVRQMAAAVLGARGYRVLQASNGGDALSPATRHPQIDLLVTDVIMPRMGGPELARKLARFHPAMRVLFISGYTENAAVHKGILEPGLQHLAKPFTPDALTRKVKEVLAPRAMNA